MLENLIKGKIFTSLDTIFITILLFATLTVRIPALTTGLTWDESSWILRSSQFISAIENLDLEKTLISYHPGVTTMWIGGVALLLKSLISPSTDQKSDIIVARFSMVFVTCIVILGVYFLTRKLFNYQIAFLGALLMSLDPFYISHSSYIHVDALVTSLMVLSVLSFLVYLENDRKPFYGILSGIFCGAACLTKTTASFLFPIIFFVILLYWVKDRRVISLILSIRMFLGWIATSLLAFCVLWPRVWIMSIQVNGYTVPISPIFLIFLLSICYWWIIKQPILVKDKGTIKNLYKMVLIGVSSILFFALMIIILWVNIPFPFDIARYLLIYHPNETPQVFLGKTYLDPGMFAFTVVLIMKTPPLTIILLLLSILYLFRGRESKGFRWRLLSLWLYIILFDIAISIPVKKLPWYILPVSPAIDILAAFAIYYLVKDFTGIQRVRMFINNRFTKLNLITNTTMISLLFYSIPVLYQLGSSLSVYPNYTAYYSPIWGGRANAPNVIYVGRGEGMDKAQEYIDSKKSEGVEYKCLYVRSTSAGVPEEDVMRYYVNEIPEYVVRLGGIEYVWVYRNKEKEFRNSIIPDFLSDR